jgi:hypothetical protein
VSRVSSAFLNQGGGKSCGGCRVHFSTKVAASELRWVSSAFLNQGGGKRVANLASPASSVYVKRGDPSTRLSLGKTDAARAVVARDALFRSTSWGEKTRARAAYELCAREGCTGRARAPGAGRVRAREGAGRVQDEGAYDSVGMEAPPLLPAESFSPRDGATMEWTAWSRARSLKYAGATSPDSAIDEALELMRLQDHAELSRQRPAHIRFRPTWAKLAGLCIRTLSDALLSSGSDGDVHAAYDHAQLLHQRLGQRDAARQARVTRDVRDGILLVCGAASGLHTLIRLRDGRLEPTFESAGSISTLRQRLNTLGGVAPYVRDLARAAIGAALGAGAPEGVEALFGRILDQWPPRGHNQVRGERVADDDFCEHASASC